MKTTLLFLSVFLTIILFFSCEDEKKEKQQNIDTKEIDNNSGNSFKNDTLQAIDLKDKLHPCFNEKSELYDEIMSWRNKNKLDWTPIRVIGEENKLIIPIHSCSIGEDMMKECDWYFDKNNDPFPLKYFGIGKVLSISEKEALPEKIISRLKQRFKEFGAPFRFNGFSVIAFSEFFPSMGWQKTGKNFCEKYDTFCLALIGSGCKPLANPNCYTLIPILGGSGVGFTIDKNQNFSNPVDFDAN